MAAQGAQCRIVAQGFSQVPGVDFRETYASTPKLSTSRYFIWMALSLGLNMEEFDVTAAYLHSDLEEVVFVKPPFGMERYDERGRPLFWKLNKSLYGLRQSGHNWMRDFFAFLRSYGFKQSQQDTSLWFLLGESSVIDMVLFVHTDDGKIAGRTHEINDVFMAALRSKFNIGAHKRNIDRMFNIKLNHDVERNSIRFAMPKYIETMMSEFNITPDSTVTAPMSADFKMTMQSELDDTTREKMNDKPYLSLLSSLFWVSRCCRPDIAVSLSILSRAASNPEPTHWRALIRVLRYTFNTRTLGITLRGSPNFHDAVLLVFTDASFATDPDTGRSISGSFVAIDGNILDWTSRHQPYVTLSSGDAETVAATSAATQVEYWRQLMEIPRGSPPAAYIPTDSTTARNILSNPMHTTTMKHIRTRLLYVRELVSARHFQFFHIPGTEQPADLLTKPLDGVTLLHLLRSIRSWGGGFSTPDASRLYTSRMTPLGSSKAASSRL